MKGNIFDIQRFCVHDGPGIRTVVFFKGCPLKCIWCHNPESQKADKSLAYYSDKCILCGKCSLVCHESCHKFEGEKHFLDREGCVLCGKCASVCSVNALELLGKSESVENIMLEVEKDSIFYKNSGGGLTVSGGEPLMQREFLAELLKSAKAKGIHTCIETCGFASQDTVTEIAKYTDIFLFDIKETDDARHKKLTGVPFSPILKNLMLLNSLGTKIILRCPLIPDVNTRDEHLANVAQIAASLDNLVEINVMAYHLLGNSKYDALNMNNQLQGHEAMSLEQKNTYIRAISDHIKEIGGNSIKVC